MRLPSLSLGRSHLDSHPHGSVGVTLQDPDGVEKPSADYTRRMNPSDLPFPNSRAPVLTTLKNPTASSSSATFDPHLAQYGITAEPSDEREREGDVDSPVSSGATTASNSTARSSEGGEGRPAGLFRVMSHDFARSGAHSRSSSKGKEVAVGDQGYSRTGSPDIISRPGSPFNGNRRASGSGSAQEPPSPTRSLATRTSTSSLRSVALSGRPRVLRAHSRSYSRPYSRPASPQQSPRLDATAARSFTSLTQLAEGEDGDEQPLSTSLPPRAYSTRARTPSIPGSTGSGQGPGPSSESFLYGARSRSGSISPIPRSQSAEMPINLQAMSLSSPPTTTSFPANVSSSPQYLPLYSNAVDPGIRAAHDPKLLPRPYSPHLSMQPIRPIPLRPQPIFGRDVLSASTGGPGPPQRPARLGLSLRELVQHKRRQASAPYFTSASAVKEVKHSVSMSEDHDVTNERRSKSRESSRHATGALPPTSLLSPPVPVNPTLDLSTGVVSTFADLVLRGEIVMTPTTEEWRSLGGQVGDCILMDEEGRKPRYSGSDGSLAGRGSDGSGSGSSGSGSGSDDEQEEELAEARQTTAEVLVDQAEKRPRLLNEPSFFDVAITPSTGAAESPTTPNALTPAGVWSLRTTPSEKTPLSVDTTNASAVPRLHVDVNGAGTPRNGFDAVTQSLAAAQRVGATSPRPVSPAPLDSAGPVDPKSYSLMTKARNIDSFAVQGDVGKGAYGMVRRAREKGPDGKARGPTLIIKYIVKRRILADCWKKHRVLGPIPVEIHVLDHIRRVLRYPVPTTSSPNSAPGSAFLATRSAPSAPCTPGGTHIVPAHVPPIGVSLIQQTGHPSICPMLDFFEDDEYYYLVMPCFGEGKDLFEHVDDHADGLAVEEVRSIFAQVADAIAFLHRHSICHRDIKDENVILDGQGKVQLIDFGSAAYVKGNKKFDIFSGTLDFAPPEVLKGDRYGGRETDIWSLGVMAYVLVIGEAPFWNSDEAINGLEPGCRADQALGEKIPSSELEDDAGGPVTDAVDLIRRCLEVDPRDRPSAAEVCQHAFLAGPGATPWSGRKGWIPLPKLARDGDEDVNSDAEKTMIADST